MPRKSISGDRSGDESDDAMSSSERSRRTSARGSVYHAIYSRLKKVNKEDGTSLVYALRLPNKRSHPEYFDTVTNPIDPDKISAKVKGQNYESVEEMAADIKLLVSNTQAFFGADSQEGHDAVAFEEAFRLAVLSHENGSPSKAPSVSSTTSGSARSGRRSMKRRETDDEDTDIEAASVAASEISESSTASQRINVTEHMLESFFASIVTYQTEKGRPIAPTFSTLPSKQLYPQYYEVIACPVDLRTIAQKIFKGSYHTFGEIERDFVTMARNAKHFNEPRSRIYQDAATLLRVIKEKKANVKKSVIKSEENEGPTVHEITVDYANLPDVKEILSPVSKMEEEDDGDEEDDDEDDDDDEEDVEEPAVNSDDDDEDYTGGGRARRRRGRPPASSTGSTSSSVKRGRGRPRKQPLPEPQSPPTSDIGSLASGPHTPATASSSAVPTNVTAALMLNEPVLPLGSPPHMAPFVDPNISNEEELIPSMLSTAATGSLRWWGEHVLEAICTAKNTMGTLLALPFMRLPSKKLYPDYFRRISEPICLAKIRRKIKRNEYQSLGDIRADLDRVFRNAQAYNMEGSDIHNVAIYLQSLTKNKFVELSQIAIKLESALTPTGVKRRQSRPFGGDSDDVTPTKRRHPMTAEEARNKRLNNLFNSVYNHVYDDGHRPRDTFMVVPSKEEYPDYYDVIQEPIDLTMIRERMDMNRYPTHQAMVADLRLMFNNARRYNEEDSQVYRDADSLDRVVKKRLKSLGPYASCTTGMSRSPGARSQQELYGTIAQQTGPPIPPLVRMMYEVFATVKEYRDLTGRQLSVPFLRLPSREEMPAYYDFISRPIEMQEMAKSLLQVGYTDFGEFMSSLFLMFDNACAFNEPDSQIYKDSLVLHQVALAKRNMLLSAAFSSGQSIANLTPSSPPDVVSGVRRLLTSLHNAMLTACDADGRGLVDSLIAGDGTDTSVTSATAARLASLHRSVARGDYKRLDVLQADWLDVLRRARVGEEKECVSSLSEVVAKSNRSTPQQRLDAAELARRWVRLRDSMCRRVAPPVETATADGMKPLETTAGESSESESSSGGFSQGGLLPTCWHILSSAMSYTEVALDRDLTEEVVQHKPLVFGDDDGEEVLPPVVKGEHEMPSVESKGQMYHVGDYVYVELSGPDANQVHIGRIARISDESARDTPEEEEGAAIEPGNDASAAGGRVRVRVAVYMRPGEAKPSKRRRLLAAEVFRTASSIVVAPAKLAGHCLVMHISQFIRSRPKNIEDRDVYVCESQYSALGEIFVKIKRWGIPTPSGVELEDRQVPFVPQRLPPSEPLESALEQVQITAFNSMSFPMPRPLESIVDEMSMADGTVSYEQYVFGDTSTVVKQGDCLYFASPNSASDRRILRVDRIWKDASEDGVRVTGVVFVFPSEVEHLPTRVFLPREVFLASNDRPTIPITAALGKCFVMRPPDFFIARPIGHRESDVFVCESKYFEEDKAIGKLKKGFKKYKFTRETMDDEYFFFNQPISPHKEASPLLVKSSPSPLSMDQLNRPPTAALHSVIATANGLTTTPTIIDSPPHTSKPEYSSIPRLAPAAATISPDVGQLAFMEAGLDRSGKKRKLRKPPSGYVIYAGEVRKKLLQDRPDAPFGEISREVGLMWRQMPSHERDIYEHKAQVIKRRMEEEETHQKARLHEQKMLAAQHQQHDMMPQQPDHHHQQQQHHQHIVVSGQPHTPHQQQAPQQHQMHFYQSVPSSGNGATVIQMMHAPVSSAPMNGQRVDQPIVAGTTAVLASPMSHTPLLTTSGGQQVVYQFPGQPGVPHQAQPHGQSLAPPNVSIGGPQVILTQQQSAPNLNHHHHHQQQQQFAMAQQVARQASMTTQGVQQLNSVDMGMNGCIGGSGTTTGVPQPLAAGQQSAQQLATQNAVVAASAAPSSLFVSVPPRTSRVLHSEIYQRYIDRLRRNAPGLSDWRKQLCLGGPEGLPPMTTQQQQHLATSFLDMPQLHAHQGTIVDALWSLRDNLLKDSLNIRTRALGFEEL